MKRICTSLFLFMSLMACNEEAIEHDFSDQAIAYDPDKIMCYTTGLQSKGTPITATSQMTTIGVFCSYTETNDWSATTSTPGKAYNTQLQRNTTSGAWEYVGTPVPWAPGSGNHKYTFFGYAPFGNGDYNLTSNPNGNGITVTSTSTTAGYPTLRYNVPTKVENQPDLMVAVPQLNRNPTGSTINLSMQHALTSVGFQVQGNGERITGIRIQGVSMSGDLVMNGTNITWSNVSAPPVTSVDLTASINFDANQSYYTTTTTMSSNLMKGNGYLMMIPQTLGATAKIFVDVQNGPTRVIQLNNLQWEAGKRVTYNITVHPYVSVSPTLLPVTYAANPASIDPLTVALNPGIGSKNWTLTSDQDWLKLSLNADGSNPQASVSGSSARQVYTIATENTGTVKRTANITMTEGTASQTVVFSQDYNRYTDRVVPTFIYPQETFPYVGAFWKCNQTGERVIRIDNRQGNTTNIGPWTAYVADKDSRWLNADDIVLSAQASSDPNLYQANPGDAESFQVEGSRTGISGTLTAGPAPGNIITFRIGLKSTYTPTRDAPARYATVYLLYGTPQKLHVIFIRQGEDPDYVFRPTDPTVSRNLVAKISPYNLSATTLNVAADRVNTDAQPSNPAVFADYPTQTGALYQWGKKIAYDGFSGPSYDQGYINGVWDNVKTTSEICPLKIRLTSGDYVKMRIPNDGSTSTYAGTNSNATEWKQSIFLDPTNRLGNSTFGYYADGYFDRRQLITIATQAFWEFTTVSRASRNVAVVGRLYYNKYNMASVFFPASGNRKDWLGTLEQLGLIGFMWSTCMQTPGNVGNGVMPTAWGTQFTFTACDFAGYNVVRSQSVRCVVDSYYP
ncbi:MAG: hypothetical protein ACRDDZ_07670 [Marinifilaceae bacterium]